MIDPAAVTALRSRAEATIAALDARLQQLQAQQLALLSSITTTSETLDTLPALVAITPIMTAIPTYTNKLSRLKRTMAAQTATVNQLKQRAMNIKLQREKNKRRMREMVEREGERDRTVLQARFTAEPPSQPSAEEMLVEGGGASAGLEGSKVEEGVSQDHASSVLMSSTASLPSSRPETPLGSQQPKVIIKRKKKPRQAEIG